MSKRRISPMSVLAYACVSTFALFCLFPFVMVLSGSVTSEADLMKFGYGLLPRRINFMAYRMLFVDAARILRAYGITLLVTSVGTFFNLLINAMAGYVLSQRHIKYRRVLSVYTILTLLFNGGMVPWYIVCVNTLHLKNHIAALIVPYLAYAWYIMLMRNFFQSTPREIYESAWMDGAGEFKIFYRIMMPLAKPALATVGLFAALGYWNDWWLGLMLIDNSDIQPLQMILRAIVSNVMFLQSTSNASMMQQVAGQIPSEGIKLAVTIVTIGPVILAYPFIQRFFIKGLVVGSVKG